MFEEAKQMKPTTLARLSALPLVAGIGAVVMGVESVGILLIGLAWTVAFTLAVRASDREVSPRAAH